MSETNPIPPGGGVPPKPAEASKIQPKKETVRISLPPKPGAARAGAAEAKLVGSTSSLNLVVPQVREVESNVKIPGSVDAPAASTQPRFTPPSTPITSFEPPKPGAPGLALASKAAGSSAPSAAPATVSSSVSKASGSKGSWLDFSLAFVAAVVAIGALVRIWFLAE